MRRDGQPSDETSSAVLGLLPRSGFDYATPVGTAILAVDLPPRPCGVLVLGHGAGGDIDAADLLAVRTAALAHELAVVRVRQPYRVAGRRAPAPAPQLDAAFVAVLEGVREGELVDELPPGLPVVVGGRSSGARVAARTSVGNPQVAGVLALAFPLTPPGKTVSRRDELVAVTAPVLILQGARDPFGSAQQVRDALADLAGDRVEVVEVPDADHSFRTRKVDPTTTREALETVRAAAARWFVELVPPQPK